jgi:hypothetical protein
MSFLPRFPSGSPEIPKLRLPRLWRPITLRANLWLRWGLKQSCSPRQEISNNMWHVTYTQINQDDSWLSMVRSQVNNLTLDFVFTITYILNTPNGSCEPILNIQVLRTFQWYKEFSNPMGFDLCNRSLKIQVSIKILTPKVEAHLGVWRFIPSHSPTFLRAWNVIPDFILGPHLHKPLFWSQAQG